MLIEFALMAVLGMDDFLEELQAIQPDAVFLETVDDQMPRREFEVTGTGPDIVTIRAGSRAAVRSAKVRLLHDLGYRFYAPRHIHRPPSVDVSEVSFVGEKAWDSRVFLAYGFSKFHREYHGLDGPGARWRTLNGLTDPLHPVGHAWRNMRSRIEASSDSPEGLFEGDTLQIDHPRAVDRIVVDRLALLAENRERNPDHFMVSIEAADSDTTPSDEYYRWANLVADGIREAEPDAWVSTYAYAGHRAPPEFVLRSNVFVQVALGFSTAGRSSYDELIADWGDVAAHVGLRDYVDVLAWTHGHPGSDRVGRFSEEMERRANHGSVFAAETSGSWMVNLWLHQVMTQTLLKGSCDSEEVLIEMVENLFEGDPEIAALYRYWATGPRRNDFLWARSFRHLERAEVRNQNWADLRDAVLIQYDIWRLMQKAPYGPEDEAEWLDVMAKVYNVMPRAIIHSYGQERRLANSAAPREEWRFSEFREPKTPYLTMAGVVPTDEEFQVEIADLILRTVVEPIPEEFEIERLPGGGDRICPSMFARTGFQAVVVGPVKYRLGEGIPVEIDGTTIVDVPPQVRLHWMGGEGSIATICHPEDPPFLEGSGNSWIRHGGGDLLVDGNPRITVFSPPPLTRWDCTVDSREVGSSYTRLPDLAEGSYFVQGSNLRGLTSIWSGPPLLQWREDRFIKPAEVSVPDLEIEGEVLLRDKRTGEIIGRYRLDAIPE